jgi:hypothetical protein
MRPILYTSNNGGLADLNFIIHEFFSIDTNKAPESIP